MADVKTKAMASLAQKQLDQLVYDLMCIDCENNIGEIEYNDEDAINALHVFSSICGNVLLHRLIKMGISQKDIHDNILNYAEVLKEVFHLFTDIDSREYYKDKKCDTHQGENLGEQ